MDIIHAEWIGKHAKIIASANPSVIGMEGVIVDETKNTVTIETETGDKKIQKQGTKFKIHGQTVSGDDVLAAPEERIKLKVKK